MARRPGDVSVEVIFSLEELAVLEQLQAVMHASSLQNAMRLILGDVVAELGLGAPGMFAERTISRRVARRATPCATSSVAAARAATVAATAVPAAVGTTLGRLACRTAVE